MIPRMGLSRFVAGSTSTPKFSSAVAPSKNKDPSGAKITGHVMVSSSSSIVNKASPSNLLSLRPSARMRSRALTGSIPIAVSLFSGTKLYNAPVSTQNFSLSFFPGLVD